MADHTGRDASLGPLHTPDGSTRKHGGEEGFLRSPTIEVESPELGNKVPTVGLSRELSILYFSLFITTRFYLQCTVISKSVNCMFAR